MKQLILVRHAKSDWGNPGLDDIDRPLNERGKKDAPAMALRLLDKKVKIDKIVSSPAKRAAKTARFFAEAYDIKKQDILYLPELYLASPAVFMKVITGLNTNADSVALFSHNDGITAFANQLTNTRIDNIPTCGVFAVKADCSEWSGFATAEKTFWFFDYPKAGLDT